MRFIVRITLLCLLVLGALCASGCDSCSCGCGDDDDDDKDTTAPATTPAVVQPSTCQPGDTVKCPDSNKVRTCVCDGTRCDFSSC